MGAQGLWRRPQVGPGDRRGRGGAGAGGSDRPTTFDGSPSIPSTKEPPRRVEGEAAGDAQRLAGGDVGLDLLTRRVADPHDRAGDGADRLARSPAGSSQWPVRRRARMPAHHAAASAPRPARRESGLPNATPSTSRTESQPIDDDVVGRRRGAGDASRLGPGERQAQLGGRGVGHQRLDGLLVDVADDDLRVDAGVAAGPGAARASAEARTSAALASGASSTRARRRSRGAGRAGPAALARPQAEGGLLRRAAPPRSATARPPRRRARRPWATRPRPAAAAPLVAATDSLTAGCSRASAAAGWRACCAAPAARA